MGAKRFVDKESCKQVALSCFNRNEFRLTDYVSYQHSKINGWLDEWFPKKYKTPIRKWTKEVLQEIALQYPTKNAFKWGNWNAYHAARRYPFFEEICSHMVTISKSDADVLYILKTDQVWNNLPVYKIGITSDRCKKRRLAELRHKSGFKYEIEIWAKTPLAKEIEIEALMYGEAPQFAQFGGYKELRAMTSEERNSVDKLLSGWEVCH